MEPNEIAELERSLKVHKSLLKDSLDRDDINESLYYLPVAGQLRVLLCDANVPILLTYAKEKGIALNVWAPVPLPNILKDGSIPSLRIVLHLRLNVASWTPFFGSREIRIEDFLDTEIGYSPSLNSQGAEPYTPRQIIKWVANKEGIAHLEFKKPQTLLGLKAWKWHSRGETFDDGLIRKIILQIGAWSYSAIEEVLNPAGDISIALRLRLKCMPESKIPLFKSRHDHNAIEINCSALRNEIEFGITKSGNFAGQINVGFPDGWKEDTDAIFCFSYSSVQKRVEVSVNGEMKDSGLDYDLGIVKATELKGQLISGYGDYFTGNVTLFDCMLSENIILGILSLPLEVMDSLLAKPVDGISNDT